MEAFFHYVEHMSSTSIGLSFLAIGLFWYVASKCIRISYENDEIRLEETEEEYQERIQLRKKTRNRIIGMTLIFCVIAFNLLLTFMERGE